MVLQPKHLKVYLTSCEIQDFELGVEIGGHNKPIPGDPRPKVGTDRLQDPL